MERYPSFAHPNIWPDSDVPGFSQAFKKLGRAVVRVGELVGRQCDRCVGERGGEMAAAGREAAGEACASMPAWAVLSALVGVQRWFGRAAAAVFRSGGLRGATGCGTQTTGDRGLGILVLFRSF